MVLTKAPGAAERLLVKLGCTLLSCALLPLLQPEAYDSIQSTVKVTAVHIETGARIGGNLYVLAGS